MIFTDFHHSSLLRSLVMLLEERLGMEVYRPIGMPWFTEGYWKINNQADTAKQYLSFEQAELPDGTPPLNEPDGWDSWGDGVFLCKDPGGATRNRACTLEFFKKNKFDYLIASIPAHVEPFKELIRKYQPQAKLIIQMGNNWDISRYAGENVLASIEPVEVLDTNVCFYHQEFDVDVFKSPTEEPEAKNVSSFVNCIKESSAWSDFMNLKDHMKTYSFRAYGGQCPDGNMNGPKELADKMRESRFVFHVKPGGDGFGHIIHNAFCAGRPIITRASDYRGQLAGRLLMPDTFIDLDRLGIDGVADMILRRDANKGDFHMLGRRAAKRFRQVVDFEREASDIRKWLSNL